MNIWLSIALLAYFLGAMIEGINAASQLSSSAFDPPSTSDHQSPQSPEPLIKRWHKIAAIASVSICGAFLWPCRLLHRTFKDDHETH
jgi:hypothetical protein